jgi:putative ABC transport system permease protein
MVIQSDVYALAAGVVIIATVLSGLLVARRLYHLDLVAVLKTRE